MDLIAKHYFNQNITTRFIRVVPLTWSYDANIRIELYGCPGTLSCNVQNLGGRVVGRWEFLRPLFLYIPSQAVKDDFIFFFTTIKRKKNEHRVTDSSIARAINTNRKDKAVFKHQRL